MKSHRGGGEVRILTRLKSVHYKALSNQASIKIGEKQGSKSPHPRVDYCNTMSFIENQLCHDESILFFKLRLKIPVSF